MGMSFDGAVNPSGKLGLRVIRADGSSESFLTDPICMDDERHPTPVVEMGWREMLSAGLPSPDLLPHVNAWRLANFPNLLRGSRRLLTARLLRLPHFHGSLFLTILRRDGTIEDLGLVGVRVVTTAGANKLVAGMNAGDTATFSAFKYHGLGTGTNAEASGDTALQTEITTEYSTDNTRPTGSQTTSGSNNVYRTVATITVDAAVANTEHGVFSQAATGGGTLLDRTKYAVVNLANGDSVAATYDFTITAGS